MLPFTYHFLTLFLTYNNPNTTQFQCNTTLLFRLFLCQDGDVEMCRLLLDEGASMEERDAEGRTALMSGDNSHLCPTNVHGQNILSTHTQTHFITMTLSTH